MSYGDYPDLSDVKKILVVKMRHHGDVLLTSPLFTQLKAALPQAQIDALLYSETLPMLEGHPAISSFLLYDKKIKKRSLFYRLWKELQFLWKIRQKRYDCVINLTEGDRGAIVAKVSKAPIRIGFDPQGKGMRGKRSCYTHVTKICPTQRHTVERQLDVLRRMGLDPKEKELFFHIPDLAHKRIQEICYQEEIKDYIVVHPVSRWRFKMLSLPQMVQLLTLLHQNNETIILTAGPDEQESALQICNALPDLPLINLAGKLSLKELGGLIARAKALICVDSVPLHIASATKTPVVALFGPTSEINWGPWMHPHASIVRSDHSCRPCFQDGCGGSKKSECLLSLSPTRIVDTLYELLTVDSFRI
jgi:heptosyltransferase III